MENKCFRNWLLILLPVFCFATAQGQDFKLTQSADPVEARWVDSIFNAMSPDERLGQLFMIRAHSDLGADHIALVRSQIQKYQVGGLCFFQGTPEKQLELTNEYQQLVRHVPLMVGVDGEWGLGMRFKENGFSFPRQLMLGAVQNNRLIYDMGQEIARQMRRIGITVNFAPVVDVNNNAENPVINTRSFGEDRNNVSVKSYMYMKGMQDHGVMACAKHFPGHGDTNVDSHYDLPVIPHSRARLDSIELYPFQALSDYGVGSFMVAHLQVPALDDRPNRPTTLSQYTIAQLLKKQMGFQGLVFTDGMEMKGVTKHYNNGKAEAEALVAGNDILLLPESLEAALMEIRSYIQSGRLSQADLDDRVRKVLRAKYRLGLQRYQPLPLANVRADLNSSEATAIKRKLIREALTLVRNEGNLIPFGEVDSLKLASLSIGASAKTPFQDRLDSYARFLHLQVGKNLGEEEQTRLSARLRQFDAVVVSLHDMSSFASRAYGITEPTIKLLRRLNKEARVILVVFGTPYALKHFDDFGVVLEAYDEDPMTQDAAAQSLFGVFALRGRLPVTASAQSAFNMGLTTKPTFRLGYAAPEEVDLNSDTLRRIGRLARYAVEQHATPGCVVLVAKDGQIVYEEAFGHHTYLHEQPVRTSDVYDLASLTKILATTLALMKLRDEGKIDLDAPIGRYLPELEGSNKAGLILRDILAHRAGLIGWIPFYKQTLTGTRRNLQPSPAFYQTQPNEEFSVPVTDKLYLRTDFQEKIWAQIRHSELAPNQGYKYSDLGFYLFAVMVERISGKPLDVYVNEHFYRPLGLQTATFRPWERLPLDRIPPSEEDRYFRRQRVQGYVHDMGAAMLGGVSGHAGLFANARDVAVLMQLFLQGGFYGGKRYLQEATVREFTNRHPNSSRRGLGFDMVQLDTRYASSLSPRASRATFGHTGFTGTCAWADPETGIVFVFLANRTYPSMNNYRLSRLGTRNRIQKAIYDAYDPGASRRRQLAQPRTEDLPLLPAGAPRLLVRSPDEEKSGG